MAALVACCALTPTLLSTAGATRIRTFDTHGVRMGLFDFLPGFQKETPPAGSVRAAHILFLAEEYADAKAEALLKRLQAGEIQFGDAARSFSCCPSRDLNGDLGTFSSLGRVGELPTVGELPYEGKDTAEFDQVVLSPSTPLNVPLKLDSAWGVHLVLVEARGAPVSGEDASSATDPPAAPAGGTEGAAW